ncbi:MAG: type II toxin-antitoxin system HigB family toxin [Planctomycetes bacterium]|nr:type II toxin-antitoxin system HigB family toxin [Planctomycetota bacterium]
MISKKKIVAYSKKNSSAKKPLEAWYKIMSISTFNSVMEVREVLNSVDPVGDYTVFNIGGNNYRLVAIVNYENQVCMIKKIMTHSEYDRWKA